MKRIISITITLCLVFCSVLPVYAEAWTSTQANNVTSDVNDIELHTQNIYQYLRDFLLSYNSGQTSDWTFGDLYWEVHRLASWIAPVGSNDGSYETLWSVLMNIAIDTRSYLPSVPIIASYVSNWMTSNLNYLNSNNIALTNYFRDAESVNVANRKLNTHTALVNSALEYKIKNINSSNVISEETLDWQNGSPLGNIAVILHRMANNDTTGLGLFLDHTVGTTFGIWDSRDTEVPVEEPNAWTPYSAVHGLYTYLAYLQRDVALMSWVVANPSDLIIRQDTEDLNRGYYDNFVDPDSDNTLTRADMDEMGDLTSGFKDNFDTGQSASGIWNVFDRDYDWFSQTTANNLQPSLTRGAEEYSTPYLDEYYKELNGILEVNKRD